VAEDDEKRSAAGSGGAALDRERFGVPERRRPREEREDRPPISSAELSKGPTELAEDRGVRVDWRVFSIAAAVIVAFSLWAMPAPTNAARVMGDSVITVATNLGRFYVLTIVVVILFVLWVAVSKEGTVRMGLDQATPAVPTVADDVDQIDDGATTRE